jgi:hypothetical protein
LLPVVRRDQSAKKHRPERWLELISWSPPRQISHSDRYPYSTGFDVNSIRSNLQTTNLLHRCSRPPCPLKMSIVDKLGQSMKSGDNCTG